MIQYNIIKTSNEGLILQVPVPGYTKENISLEIDKGNLILSVDNKKSNYEYIRKGISKPYGEWVLDPDLKVDMATCTNGMLEILCSKVIPVTNGTRIQIQ